MTVIDSFQRDIVCFEVLMTLCFLKRFLKIMCLFNDFTKNKPSNEWSEHRVSNDPRI